jgi:hypothetical protein
LNLENLWYRCNSHFITCDKTEGGIR